MARPRTWWRLPRAKAEPAKSSAPLITQPSGSMRTALRTKAADEQADGLQSTPVDEVDVLALLGLADAAAGDVDGVEARRR